MGTLVDVPENAVREEPLAFGLTAPQLLVCGIAVAIGAGIQLLPVWVAIQIVLTVLLAGPVLISAILPIRGEPAYRWLIRWVRYLRGPRTWFVPRAEDPHKWEISGEVQSVPATNGAEGHSDTAIDRLGESPDPVNDPRQPAPRSRELPMTGDQVARLRIVDPAVDPGGGPEAASPAGESADRPAAIPHVLPTMRVVAVAGFAGGTGRTTLAAEIATLVGSHARIRSLDGVEVSVRVLVLDAARYRTVVYQTASMRAALAATDLQLSPDGRTLTSYVAKPCHGQCSTTSGTWPDAAGAADRASVAEFDGLSRTSMTTTFRTPNANPIVTRQATAAGVVVDNWGDALGGGETLWSQDADQYAAWVAASPSRPVQSDGITPTSPYITTYAYDAHHQLTHTVRPIANPVGTAPLSDIHTTRDVKGRPIAVDDNTWVKNPGFETGLNGGWSTYAGTATLDSSTSHGGTNSVKTFSTSSVTTHYQAVLMAPGQTLRVQAWVKAAAGSTANLSVGAFRRSDGSYVAIGSLGSSATLWTQVAADVTIPTDTTGEIHVELSTPVGQTAWWDDVSLFTTYATTTYAADGLVTDRYELNGASATGLTRTHIDYGATSAHPGITATRTIANFLDGTQGPGADEDATSTAEADAWGRIVRTSDPDNKSATTTYAANATDIASTQLGTDPATTFTYDAVGNRLSTTSPMGESTSVDYDLFNHPVLVTAPDGTKTKTVFDDYGQATTTITNFHGSGTPNDDGSGIDDITSTATYDAEGNVLNTTTDTGYTGAIAASTDSTYDLLGNVVSVTMHPGTGPDRTTTTYFDAAGHPAGTRGPALPSETSAPACPGVSGVSCNRVTTFDATGRPSQTIDVYGNVTRTLYDLDDRPVRSTANYADDVPTAADPDTDLVTTTIYDIAGQVTSTTDPAGRTTTSAADALKRVTMVTRPDGSFAKTVYSAGGRVDRSSAIAAAGTLDNNLVWTKSLYDAAGRTTKTLAHYDPSGTARLRLSSFEGGIDGWAGTSTGWFTGDASMLSAVLMDSKTGAKSLSVATGSGGWGGAWLDLSGSTFKQGHTYRVRAWVKAPAGLTVEAFLGVDASGGDYTSIATATASGGWQVLDGTWTPSGDRSANVHLAIRRPAAGPVTLRVDDVVIWDVAGADSNIPSETVYDGDGRAIESILPPGDLTKDLPLVTVTTYDSVGRVIAVRTAATPMYPAVVASEPLPVGHWRLDEASGTGAADAIGTHPMTASGGVALGAAPAIDERPSASMAFDGSTGKLQVPFDKTAWGLTGSTISLEAWFRTARTTGKGDIVRNSHYGLGFWLAQNGPVMEAVIYGAAQGTITVAGYQDNTWHHMVATANGTTMALYMDGVLKGTTPLSGTLNLWNDNVAVGAIDSNAEYFAGSIDEVAIYASALSADQVSTHFGVGRSPDRNLLTTSTYDALGNRTTTSNPKGVVTRFGYDRLGRVTSTIANYLDGSASGEYADDDVKSTFAYDDLGELTGYCPAAQTYAGGCDATVAANPQAWHYGYDAAGHVEVQTPPVRTSGITQLASTRWEYDSGGRLAASCDTTAPASTCTAGGASVIRTITPRYDDAGRIIRSDTTDGTGALALRTETTYYVDGQPKQTIASTGSGPTLLDTLDFAYDSAGRPTTVTRSGTTIAAQVWNPDDTLATRTDGDAGALGTTTFTYDWAKRLTQVQEPSVFGATATFGWRLDGLIASRTWATGGAAATFDYDAAKRPTAIAKGALSFGQAYDRNGNVTADTRSLGFTGPAGADTQRFTYDALDRVTASSGLGTTYDRAFTYDRDGNRRTKTDGGVSFTYSVDRTDQLVSVSKAGGTAQAFAYDARGNMTGDAQTGTAVTTYTYDLGNKLTGIDAGGSAIANDATFTFDALGRFATRVLVGSGTSDTYGYVGVSETVARIASVTGGVTTNTDSIVSATGDRIGVKVGGTVNWLLPDLHGNTGASLSADEAAVTNAIRYDAYGMTLATGNGAGAPDPVGDKAWTYQGRLDISPEGLATPLYDMGARFYAPGIGGFTQLDSVMGSAQNPLSMNRFLYAQGNPATLVDPDGAQRHRGRRDDHPRGWPLQAGQGRQSDVLHTPAAHPAARQPDHC